METIDFNQVIQENISVVEGLIDNRLVKYYKYDVPAKEEVDVDMLRGFVTVSISTSASVATFMFTDEGYVMNFNTSYNGAIDYNNDNNVITIKRSGIKNKIRLKNNNASSITVSFKVLNL